MDARGLPQVVAQNLSCRKKRKVAHNSEDGSTGAALPIDSRFPNRISQESGSEQSASKWFDHVNNNISQAHGKVETPGDSPFFLSHEKSGLPMDSVPSRRDDRFGGQYQTENESENADLRGVIDDLTVENKRLKQLLREQRARSTSAHDPQGKLLEIRMYDLPSTQKMEFEHLVKNFVTKVHATMESQPSSNTTRRSTLPSSEVSPNSQLLAGTKHGNTDSGYVSNSNSGPASATASHWHESLPPVSRANRSESIKDHHIDIPDAVRSRQSHLMAERTKMALIVRRLERLFTGKQASPHDNSLSVQQQEVSWRAARADRKEDAKNNRVSATEGLREAPILSQDAHIRLEAMDRNDFAPSEENLKTQGVSETFDPPSRDGGNMPGTNASNSPHQRPTRPLDLEIDRAQVPAENIEYMRHLGLSPHCGPGAGTDERAWVYLNILVNMAQLHTLNVTPSFVRKAIKELSTKLELSNDGHKVRWSGGTRGTTFSNEDERALDFESAYSRENVQRHRVGSGKKSQMQSCSQQAISTTPSDDVASSRLPENSAASFSQTRPAPCIRAAQAISSFDYRPIVYTGKQHRIARSYLEIADPYESTSDNSGSPEQALTRSDSNHAPNADPGTITFFNNPYFYSDISAGKVSSGWRPGLQERSTALMGVSLEMEIESPLRHHDACYFTPQFTKPQYTPPNNGPSLLHHIEPIKAAGNDSTPFLDLPVSGVGGVMPADNFGLEVKLERVSVTSHEITTEAQKSRTIICKPKPFSYAVQQCKRFDLKPSSLPPPSYVFFTSQASSDSVGMSDSPSMSESTSAADEEYPPPSKLLNYWSTETSSDWGEMRAITTINAEPTCFKPSQATDSDSFGAHERKHLID